MINNEFCSNSYESFFSQNFESEYENINEYDISLRNELSSQNSSNESIIFIKDKREDLSSKNIIFSSSDEINFSQSIESQKEEDNQIYYIKNEQNNENTKISLENINTSKSDSTQLIIHKKRGREKQNDSNDSNGKDHNKFARDNILRKVQVHYINFIILFVNYILKILNYDQQFLKLEYNFKKKVNKKYVELLKSKTIGEIICNRISLKFTKHEGNNNVAIYKQIQYDEVLNKILSEKYLQFFKKFYYKSNNIINLKEYGLDKNIILGNDVKMFKDLLKDNENFTEYKEYQKNIIECIKQNFVPDLIFHSHKF